MSCSQRWAEAISNERSWSWVHSVEFLSTLCFNSTWKHVTVIRWQSVKHDVRLLSAAGYSSPNSISLYADFHRNFPAGKVADTNHERRGHKPFRHVEMFATKYLTNLQQNCLCRSRLVEFSSKGLQCTWNVWLGSLTCQTCNPEVAQRRRFDSAPGHCRVTTLGKFFTHVCLCHQAV